MSPRPRSFVSAIALVLATFALGVFFVSPAVALAQNQSNSPGHVWIDPTKPDDRGNIGFTVTFMMPPTSVGATSAQSVPDMSPDGKACQILAPEPGGQTMCVLWGTPIPGDYVMTASVTDGANEYNWTVPITVCPLTGCADLFSLSIEPEPIYVWADPQITDQTYGTMRYNVPWNASETRMTPLVDRNGHSPSGDYHAVFEPPIDGSTFGFEGSFTERGVFYTTITVDDEFGNPHSADATVVVCDSRGCPVLPSTGVNASRIVAIAVGALTALAVGILVLGIYRRRRVHDALSH